MNELINYTLSMVGGFIGGWGAYAAIKYRTISKMQELTRGIIKGYNVRFQVQSVCLTCNRCDIIFFSKCFDDISLVIADHESKCPVLKVVK